MSEPLSAFDLAAYLARIGYSGIPVLDLATLRSIQIAHVGAIPFENFDIQMGLPIRLDIEHLSGKLIGQRRGGYCFEQNGLLYAALVSAGFDVRRRLARVRMGGDPGGRSHLILLVTIDGREYLCDAGFGWSYLAEPLPLAAGEYSSACERWRLRASDWSPGWELEVWRDGNWFALYWFGDEPVVEYDLIISNHFTCSHPVSRFVTNRVAARTTLTERHTLLNNRYRLRVNGEQAEELEITDEAMFRQILSERFLIELPDGAILRPIDGIHP